MSETLLHVSFTECVSTPVPRKEGFFRLAKFVPMLKNNREKCVVEQTEILQQTVDSIIHDVMQPQDMYFE